VVKRTVFANEARPKADDPGMLKKIHIRNYRSCHDVTLDNLTPVTALVGRNGVGKTNILWAIDWASRSATSTQPLTLFGLGMLPNGPMSVSIETALGGSDLRYEIEISLEPRRDNSKPYNPGYELKESVELVAPDGSHDLRLTRTGEDIHLVGREHPVKVRPLVPCLPVLASLLPEDDPLSAKVREVVRYFGGILYAPSDEPARPGTGFQKTVILSDRDYHNWLLNYEQRGDRGESVPFWLIYMARSRPDRFAEFVDLLGPTGLDLIDEVRFREVDVSEITGRQDPGIEGRKFLILEFRPSRSAGGDGESFYFDALSHGTRRLLRILAFVYFGEPSVLLLEHPEDGIHRNLLWKLISMLQSGADFTQYILASHSPDVFNALRPADIRLVSINRGMTEVRELSAHELGVAARFLKEEGSLSDFLEVVQSD
jgi:predicted ATPase